MSMCVCVLVGERNGEFKISLPGPKRQNPELFLGTDEDINIQKVEGSWWGQKNTGLEMRLGSKVQLLIH